MGKKSKRWMHVCKDNHFAPPHDILKEEANSIVCQGVIGKLLLCFQVNIRYNPENGRT